MNSSNWIVRKFLLLYRFIMEKPAFRNPSGACSVRHGNSLQRFILQGLPCYIMGPFWLTSYVMKIAGLDESAIYWQNREFHIRVLRIKE